MALTALHHGWEPAVTVRAVQKELQQLELMLKKTGTRAESLAEKKGHSPFG